MRRSIVYTMALCLAFCPPVQGAEAEYMLVIQEHQFHPAELKVPAGQKLKLWVDNQDPTAEEFESYDLNREKVIPGGKKAALFVGPLKPGVYKFFGEFHPQTAQGTLVAEAP